MVSIARSAETNVTGVQQELLGVMRRNHGRWPSIWHLRVHEHRAMLQLVRRGLAERDGRDFKLVTE